MLLKTRGIVLHSVPYSDKYGIVHVYTEDFGRVSYMVARSRGKKSRVAPSLFMPLTVVEMDVEHLNTREIQRIRETRLCFPVNDTGANPVKNCIALFVAEVLFRIIRPKEPDAKLFNYLCDSVRWLELARNGVANFHLVFLIQLVQFFGVAPDGASYMADSFFDLVNGSFTLVQPEHNHYLDRAESVIFSRLLRMSYANMELFAFSRPERQNIISRILEYYRIHISDFHDIKSLAVLQGIFDAL